MGECYPVGINSGHVFVVNMRNICVNCKSGSIGLRVLKQKREARDQFDNSLFDVTACLAPKLPVYYRAHTGSLALCMKPQPHQIDLFNRIVASEIHTDRLY